MTVLARSSGKSKLQNTLIGEGAPHKQTFKCLTVIIIIWSWAPDGGAGHQDRHNFDFDLRVDSWSNVLVVRQLTAGKNVSTEAENIVEIRHQATTGEDKLNSEGFTCAVGTA
jgi:hypothetical protein